MLAPILQTLDSEGAFTLKQLLLLQIAPQRRDNANLVEEWCRAIIKDKIVASNRVRHKVYNIGVRTGTKILDKGKDYLRKGT